MQRSESPSEQKLRPSRRGPGRTLQLASLSLLILLSQSACQSLPQGTSLLPDLKAADLEPRLPVETSNARASSVAKAIKPARTSADRSQPAGESLQAQEEAPLFNPSDHYTPLEDTPSETSAAPATGPGVILIIPAQPQPSPSVAPPAETQPGVSFSVKFAAHSETELSAYYPVRISLENAKGAVLSMKEAFSAELATGVQLTSSGLKPGEGYRMRIAGKASSGTCLSQAQFLLTGDSATGDTRQLSEDATSLTSSDFAPVPLKLPCQPSLRVHGQVVDRHGNGLPGVQLEAKALRAEQSQKQTEKLDFYQQTVSDSSGFYTLEAFPAGVTVHLSGSQGGFASTEKLLQFSFNQIDSFNERHDGNLVMLEAE